MKTSDTQEYVANNVAQQLFMARLSWVAKAQDISETLATPHRLFDVDAIKTAAKQDDPIVAMQLGFIECCNTGCRSPLERFICRVVDENGEATNLLFMVDLIQGLTALGSPDVAMVA